MLCWWELVGRYPAFPAGDSRSPCSGFVLCGDGSSQPYLLLHGTWAVPSPLALPCPVSVCDGHNLQVRCPFWLGHFKQRGTWLSQCPLGLLTITIKNACPIADLNYSSSPNFQLLIFLFSSPLD